MPRTRRAETTRAAESRKADARPMPKTTHQSSTYVPPEVVPKGMTYRWVRISVHNEPDQSNWTNKTMGGWRPVPRTRHLDIWPFIPMPGMNADSDNIINGGLILCEKPTREVQRDKAARETDTEEQMESIAWTTEGLAGAPKVNESSRVERGHLAFKQEE